MDVVIDEVVARIKVADFVPRFSMRQPLRIWFARSWPGSTSATSASAAARRTPRSPMTGATVSPANRRTCEGTMQAPPGQASLTINWHNESATVP